jgi:PTH1 family peptidyl-tRNA hydrolase
MPEEIESVDPAGRSVPVGQAEREEPPDGMAEPGVRTYFIVGLGNPGLRYENTPHNIGFMVLDRLAERNGIRIRSNEGVTLTGTGKICGRDVVLAKPQTFMNRSGASAKAVMQNRRLSHKDLVLVYDDIDLPWTALRIKKKGSAGGHNGVKSVIAEMRTDWFVRVRIGIRPDHEIEDTAQYVLAPLERALKVDLDEVLTYAAEAIESIVAEGAIKSMTRFNRRARGLKDEEE